MYVLVMTVIVLRTVIVSYITFPKNNSLFCPLFQKFRVTPTNGPIKERKTLLTTTKQIDSKSNLVLVIPKT